MVLEQLFSMPCYTMYICKDIYDLFSTWKDKIVLSIKPF